MTYLSLSFPFSFLFSHYNHHHYHHYHHYHNYHNYHQHHHHDDRSFRPLFIYLRLGNDNRGPRACSFGTFLVQICFLGHPMGEKCLRVIIS